MTRKVVTVRPETTVRDIAALLVERRISAVPVTDAAGHVVGMVSEGDLMRRPETGTARPAAWWLRAFASPAALAERYVKSHGLTAAQVMTQDVATIPADAPLAEAAALMETRGVKRLPVLRNDTLVGILSRANLVRALAAAGGLTGGTRDDTAARERVEAAFDRAPWFEGSDVYVLVLNGLVELWGTVATPAQREAAELAARRVPGIHGVKNHLIVRETASGGLAPLF